MNSRHLFLINLTCLCLCTIVLVGQSSWHESLSQDTFFDHSERIRYNYPDSAILLLDQKLAETLDKRDTILAIQVMQRRAHFTGHLANYKESYDYLWKALALANQSRNLRAKSSVCISLGRYYSYFKRKSKAIAYFDSSMVINKHLISIDALSSPALAENYYVMAETMRILEEFDQAKLYLDSAYQLCSPNSSSVQQPYLDFERAILSKEAGEHKKAITLFDSIQGWFAKHDPGYQVLLHTYLGDAYRESGDLLNGETQYRKAIKFSNRYHAHIDFSPLIHEKLAALYVEQSNIPEALTQLQIAKKLNERFFDSRSENNRPLMEIQDAFREEQNRNQLLMQKQRMTELEHQNQVWFLQRIILFGCLLFIVVLGFLYLKYVQSKHKVEKRLLRKERELKIKKAHELVELKNKELATSTLKLIEKDELLVSLREKLRNGKSDLGATEIKQIIRTINTDTLQNWEEFETRFIAVNRDFYQRLKASYPKLTQGDQKICALIKLNFSSKDMARLLGISVESVHTTRYRLRKKLNLAREVNLGEFIANI